MADLKKELLARISSLFKPSNPEDIMRAKIEIQKLLSNPELRVEATEPVPVEPLQDVVTQEIFAPEGQQEPSILHSTDMEQSIGWFFEAIENYPYLVSMFPVRPADMQQWISAMQPEYAVEEAITLHRRS